MSYEDEDQVDWSDGSLDDCGPSTSNPSVSVDDRLPTHTNETSLQEAPIIETRIGSSEPVFRPSRPSASRQSRLSPPRQKPTNGRTRTSMHTISAQTKHSRNAHRPYQRQPTKDELSKFVLYQANQKVYEAMFIKTFVSHVLHSDRLGLKGSLSDSPDSLVKIEGYLKDVSNNVNQLANKMIWNAHFKTTNFLAKPGQDSLAFINADSFKDSLFNDLDSKKSLLVVQKMNQSWHRSYNAASMVQQSASNYPVGLHYSPFEDIEEATTQKLFIGKGLAPGRVVKPPMKKRVLPGSARHESRITPTSSRVPSNAQRTKPPLAKSAPRVPLPGPKNGDVPSPALKEVTPTHVPILDAMSMHDFDVINSKTTYAPITIPDVVHPDAKPSLLEQLIAQSNSNIPLGPLIEKAPSRLETLFAGSHMNRGQKDWRMELINDHKWRLAKRRRKQPSKAESGDFKSIIARAVGKGLLQHPTAQIQKRINSLVEYNSKAEQKSRQSYPLATGTILPFGKLDSSSCSGSKLVTPSREVGKTQRQSGRNSRKRPRIQLEQEPLPPHPSGSRTLELHQVLPEQAYFAKSDEEEKLAWRCGLRHCMGYYYNAGDRMSCVGCNTNIREIKITVMDFYLPSRTWSYQLAPGITWKPSKMTKESKLSSRCSHNSIAKIAWYAAFNAGATEEEALQKAIETVLEHLRPKQKPEPEPTPEAEVELIDLGPHPSGSTTMEHGQGIPECHSFKMIDKFGELAWRCDGGHALGRYYMAGDKRTCPGCGLSKSNKLARNQIMDFYMPFGAVVRQEAPELVEWHPRRKKAKESTPITTHNQICTKIYHKALEEGIPHDRALAFALKATDEHLDAKNDEIEAHHEEMQRKKAQKEHAKLEQENKSKIQRLSASSGSTTPADGYRRNSDEGVVIMLVPQKRDRDEVNSGSEEAEEDQVDEAVEEETDGSAAVAVEISSGDESSSDSDSE